MKRICLSLMFLLLMGSISSIAQTLNYTTNWPDSGADGWVITNNGENLLADPTVDAAFGYDDDSEDASPGLDNSQIITSPIIDLTAAAAAGEVLMEISLNHDNRDCCGSSLFVEYWDADAGAWVLVSALPGSFTTADYTDASPDTPFSSIIDVTSFTANQLANFMIRVVFDDDSMGATPGAWSYGFVIGAPSVVSSAPLLGCIDPCFTEYDPTATGDDGSCATAVAATVCDDGNACTINDMEVIGLDGSTCVPCAGTPDPAVSPANATCASATPVADGDVVAGTTECGTLESALGFCGTSITAPGVWYVLSGDGGAYNVDICDASHDSKMTIFSGTCGALVCETGEDDDCGNDADIQFSTVAGTDYFILVHGFGTNEGTFDLTVVEIPSGCTDPCFAEFDPAAIVDDGSCLTSQGPANNVCSGAIAVSIGDVVTGNTDCGIEDADADALGSCGTAPGANGIWYSLEGDGTTVSLSLCNSGFDTKVNVYSGGCGADLVCEAGNDDNFGVCGAGARSYLEFPTTAGESYLVYVNGFSGSTGDIELAVDCVYEDGVCLDVNRVCMGNALFVPDCGAAGYTFTWTNDDTALATVVTGSSAFSPTVPGTYSFSATNGVTTFSSCAPFVVAEIIDCKDCGAE